MYFYLFCTYQLELEKVSEYRSIERFYTADMVLHHSLPGSLFSSLHTDPQQWMPYYNYYSYNQPNLYDYAATQSEISDSGPLNAYGGITAHLPEFEESIE